MKKYILNLFFFFSFIPSLKAQSDTCYSGRLYMSSERHSSLFTPYVSVGAGFMNGDTGRFTAFFDGLKYTGTNLYRVDAIPYDTFPSHISKDSFLMGTDVWSTDTTRLPFVFKFFGCEYSSLHISENGIISFDPYITGGTARSGASPSTIPDTFYSAASILSNLQNLIPNTKIYSYLRGTAPCREYEIRFKDEFYFSDLCGGAYKANCSIILHECTNIIDIFTHSQHPCSGTNSGRAITGIQSYDKTRAYAAPGRNNVTYTEVNGGWRFSPIDTAGIINKVVLFKNDTIPIDTVYGVYAPFPHIKAEMTYVFSGLPASFKARLYSSLADSSICYNGLVIRDTGITVGGSSAPGSEAADEATNAIGIGGRACDINYFDEFTIDAYDDPGCDYIEGTYGADFRSSYPIVQYIDPGAPVPPGLYTQTAIDSYGCSVTYTFEINLHSEPFTFTIDAIVPAICGDEGIIYYTLDGGIPHEFDYAYGGIAYRWYNIDCSDGSSFYYPSVRYPPLSGYLDHLYAGTYTITADVSGCPITYTFTIPGAPPVRFDTTITTCPHVRVITSYRTFDVAGSFYDTLTNYRGCDSIIHTTVNYYPAVRSTQTRSICPGSTYRIGVHTYSSSGTYIDTILSYRGCDSIVTTNLIILNLSTITNTVTHCDTSGLAVGVHYYHTTGTYRDTFRSFAGCDSVIVITNLYVYHDDHALDSINICSGDSVFGYYPSHDSLLILHSTTSHGCDSIYRKNIHVLSSPLLSISTWNAICQDEGQVLLLMSSGSPIYTISNASGYSNTSNDSLRITNLYAGQYDILVTDINACTATDTFNILATGIASLYDTLLTTCPHVWVFTNYDSFDLAGSYYDTLNTYEGCDSVIHTTINYYPSVFGSQSQFVCTGDVYRIGMHSYSTAGIYIDTLASYRGCDSIVTTNLILFPTPRDSFYYSHCDSFSVSVGAHTYRSTGIYYDTLSSMHGCDSFIITNLYVYNATPITRHLRICAGDTLFGTYPLHDSLYTLHTISFHGCDSIYFIDLVIDSLPRINTSVVNAFCSNEGQVLIDIDGGNPSYSITCSSGYSGITSDTQRISNLFAGNYFVSATDIRGCKDSVAFNIAGITSPSFYDTTLSTCPRVRVFTNYNSFDLAGIYYDTINNYLGCDSVIQTTINYFSPSYFSQSISLCPGSVYSIGSHSYGSAGLFIDTLSSHIVCDSIVTTSISLLNTSMDSITTILCDTGSISIGAHNYTVTGIYHDTLNTFQGCDSIIISNLYVYNEIPMMQSVRICFGDTLLGSHPQHDSLYSFHLPSMMGCDSIYQINVTVDPLPTINLGNDTTIIAEDAVRLVSAYDASFWSTGEIVSSIVVTPIHDSIFYVRVVDTSTGCYTYDSIIIFVLPRLTMLGMPSGFTPNGDGLNDYFFPLIHGNYTIQAFNIFNRYGVLVYSGINSIGWDGKFLGIDQPIETYVYYLDIELSDGSTRKLNGTVTLIR